MIYVFDWDGTLLNSLGKKIENCAQILSTRYGFDFSAVQDAYRKYNGLPRRDLYRRIFHDLSQKELPENEYMEISAEFDGMNLRSGKQAALYTDVMPFLQKIQGKHAAYVSSSASQKEVDELTMFHGVRPFLRASFGSTKSFFKGEPHFTEICRREKCELKDLFFVGDDENDVRLAQAANVAHAQLRREVPAQPKLNVIHSLLNL